MTLKTGVKADENSDLYHWIKLYVYITSDTEKSENSSHDRFQTSEHNETNAHWRIFFRLFCKM